MRHSTGGGNAEVKSDQSLRALQFGDKERRRKRGDEARMARSTIHHMRCEGGIMQVLAKCSDLPNGGSA